MTNPQRTFEPITVSQFRDAAGTEAWPILTDGATTFFRTDSFATSARLVSAISAIEGLEGRRPAIDIRDDGVTVRLLTRAEKYWGMSREDIQRARRITEVAATLGLRPDGSDVEAIGPIVIGVRNAAAVMPFWRALMGYEYRSDTPDEDLVDPRDRGPGLWFETMDEPTEGRNRMHVSVWVAYEQAEARVAAAVAAGGKVIFDRAAPAWWTLVDPEGNEADVATTMTRA